MDLPVLIVALGFALMGAAALWRPAHIGRFFDVRFDSVDGRNEVRAVYGGFGLAVAAALVIALDSTQFRAGVILCVALALAGMAGGRVIGALIERPGFWPWLFCAVEATAAGLLGWSLT